MSAEQTWRAALAEVPPARRALYTEIRSKLLILIGNPVRESETALRILLDQCFEPGSRVLGNLTYEWRLSRLPFYIEWTVKKNNGELYGVTLQSASLFLQSTQHASFLCATKYILKSRTRVDEEIEETVRETRESLPNSSALNLATAAALAKLKQEKTRQTWESKTKKYLADKGFGMHDIGEINIALAQLLAELFVDGRTGSEYLALLWDDYSKEKHMKQTRATWADLPTSLSTNTPDLKDPVDSLSTRTPDLTDLPYSPSNSIPDLTADTEAPKKKRQRNKRKRKAERKIKKASLSEAHETSTIAHRDDTSEGSQDKSDGSPAGQGSKLESMFPGVETIDWASDIPDSPRDIQKSHIGLPDIQDLSPKSMPKDIETIDRALKVPEPLRDVPKNHVDPLATNQPVSVSANSSVPELKEQSITSRKSSETSLMPTQGTKSPASSSKVVADPSKKGSQLEATSIERPSSSDQRLVVAVPDLKFFRKHKDSASETEKVAGSKDEKTELMPAESTAAASGAAVTEVADVGKHIRPQISSFRQHSMLRPQAPEFIPSFSQSHPQSQMSSPFTSPEIGPLGSVPMSMTTSATTVASASGESTRQSGSVRKITFGQAPTIDLTSSGPPFSHALVFANSHEDATQDESNQDLSTSTTLSSAVEKLDLKEDDEQRVDKEQLLQTWPTAGKADPANVVPWRYAKFGVESPEEIIMKHGHHDNNYAVDPWYTTVRQEASEANMIPPDAPAVLMKTKSGFPIATGQYDANNNVWRIFAPSSHPGADLRELDDHPDYLESAKLLEVQGCEMFCYNVHVAIRLLHTCQHEKCKREIVDSLPHTQVCLGCGPLAPVRYCSISCLFDDLPNHWKECGASKFWPPSNQVVDPDISFPLKFNGLIPMIKDISGWDSLQRRRIHFVANYLNGDYAIFPEDSMRIFEIKPVGDGVKETRKRIQRLFNCALLDRRNTSLIAYLYLLIRDALFVQIKMRYGEYPVVLRLQFIHEWNYDYKGELGYKFLDDVNSCDCMWFGLANSPNCNGADGRESTCKAGTGLAEPHRTTGLKAHVEQLEREHWILRAWQTKHDRVSDWRERVYGRGFNGVKPRKFKDVLPVLGIGFEGHISKDKIVGEWRPRLNLEATPPKAKYTRGQWKQDPTTFIWKEAEN